MRLNRQQSKKVDKARKEATTLFERQRVRRRKIHRQLLVDLNKQRDRIDGRVAEFLGIDNLTALRRGLEGQSLPKGKIALHKAAMHAVDHLQDKAIQLGYLFGQEECFSKVVRMWQDGAISKFEYLVRFLGEHKSWDVYKSLDYLDLSFGVGSKGQVLYGQGIADHTKRTYRSKLPSRLAARKVKQKS